MNICILRSNKFSYSETFIDNQIAQLEPKVLLYEGWFPSILPNGKSFLPFPLSILLVRGGFRNILPNVYRKLYHFFLAQYLKKQEIAVVLANYGPMGASVYEACQRVNIPLVVHFHGFDGYHFDTLNKYASEYKKMFEYATKIIVVSNDMNEQLLNLGAKPSQIVLNPYGVSLDKFWGAKPAQAPIRFVYVGRFTAKKSPENLLRAFNLVQQQIPEARLVTVGDGELFEHAQALAIELGIADKVEFKGKKTPIEIAEILRTARCFVQHSVRAINGDSEGTPNTVLEASATGLPIVSTTHAGIRDAVVHGETGFLVEEGDWKSMASYMIRFAQFPDLAEQMGQAARKHIEKNYGMQERADSLKIILKQTIL